MKYPPSILTEDLQECFICKDTRRIEIHHVFGGPNRKHSTKYGLVVGLCNYHHTGSRDSVHKNAILSKRLRKFAQQKFEEQHSHELFMEVFKKNYI